MNKTNLCILAIFIGTMLSGCVTTEKKFMEEGNKPLTQSQLETLFSQTITYDWKNTKGNTGVGTTRPDHTGEAKWNGGSETAKWDIRGNEYCIIFNSGKESCRTVYKTGEKEYTMYENGAFRIRWTLNE